MSQVDSDDEAFARPEKKRCKLGEGEAKELALAISRVDRAIQRAQASDPPGVELEGNSNGGHLRSAINVDSDEEPQGVRCSCTLDLCIRLASPRRFRGSSY